MGEVAPTLEEIVKLAKQLTPVDKLRLLERVIPDLEAEFESTSKAPLRSSCGALADPGPAPSEEEIDEARHEMWGNFPRDDI